MAHDNAADKIAMLLSTDWFQPYWQTIGLNTTLESRRCIQQGCRGIVNQMVGDAEEYWLISFAEERVRATREAVLSLAAGCGLDVASAERLMGLCRERPERVARENTASLLCTVTAELITDDGLTSEIKLVLERTGTILQPDKDFKVLSSESQSSWDRRIRDLTPDLPTYLSDWLSVGVLAESALDYVLTSLAREQQRLLRKRFRAAAQRITGLEEEQLPDNW